MPIVTHYDPGAPCWFELGTTDQSSAKHFYTGLLGWSFTDYPMGELGSYTIFNLSGRDTAAAYTIQHQGMPPNWMVYFSVGDVDSSTAKIAGIGGKVVQGPFNVMDKGRMSICADPGGAMFCLWQKGSTEGADVFGDDNTVCWAELATWDTAQARDFYTQLLGWTTRPSANMPTYLEYSVAGQPRGGLLPMDDNWKGMPSHWAIYFKVVDCDAATAKAKQLGGTLVFGPFEAPGVGRIALISDPQGAKFYMITLKSAA